MAQCPNCGAAVAEEASFCIECGTALGGQQGKQPQGRNQPSQQAQGQPQQPQNQPPRGSPTPGNTDTSRRKFLKYGGGAAVVGVGGFLVWDNFLSGDESSAPEQTVQDFWSAMDSGDVSRARQYVVDTQSGSMTPQEEQMFERADISVRSTTLVDKSDDRATVEADIQISMMGQSDSATVTHELRKVDGTWKLSDVSGF